jgi:hypothetical protein
LRGCLPLDVLLPPWRKKFFNFFSFQEELSITCCNQKNIETSFFIAYIVVVYLEFQSLKERYITYGRQIIYSMSVALMERIRLTWTINRKAGDRQAKEARL